MSSWDAANAVISLKNEPTGYLCWKSDKAVFFEKPFPETLNLLLSAIYFDKDTPLCWCVSSCRPEKSFSEPKHLTSGLSHLTSGVKSMKHLQMSTSLIQSNCHTDVLFFLLQNKTHNELIHAGSKTKRSQAWLLPFHPLSGAYWSSGFLVTSEEEVLVFTASLVSAMQVPHRFNFMPFMRSTCHLLDLNVVKGILFPSFRFVWVLFSCR